MSQPGAVAVPTRRQTLLLLLTAACAAPAQAQSIVTVERGNPERTAILDVARGSVERRLGIKVVFVVARLAMTGDWAFASLRPRTESGQRIDYRKTRIAKDFVPDQDSDTAGFLFQRKGGAWTIVEEVFLPGDVYWEEWQEKYKLPRALFFTE